MSVLFIHQMHCSILKEKNVIAWNIKCKYIYIQRWHELILNQFDLKLIYSRMILILPGRKSKSYYFNKPGNKL